MCVMKSHPVEQNTCFAWTSGESVIGKYTKLTLKLFPVIIRTSERSVCCLHVDTHAQSL